MIRRTLDQLAAAAAARCAKLDKLPEQEREIRTGIIKMIVCLETFGAEPEYSLALDRCFPDLLDVPADRLRDEVRRIVAEVLA